VSQKKILIVDDESFLRDIVSAQLKAEGYDIVQATDGMEGLEKAKKENPDLIILDIMLPKMKGYEVCGALKADPKYNNIPIILFSAKAEEKDKDLGKKVGADAYITKLFGSKELLAKVKELIG
jgi:DNA-binding response OmpR family regulator